MPIHDWTRVPAGVFHDFHNAWITELRNALNDGLLPPDFYALGEQRSGEIGPDILTLRVEDETSQELPNPGGVDESPIAGMVAVAEAPPGVSITQDAEEDARYYLSRQRSVVVRHVSGDRMVAIIEIVSPANKHSHGGVDDLVDKIVAALTNGIHVMVIDLLPPRRHDPEGLHGAVWEHLMAGTYETPQNRRLTLASYAARHTVTAYVEPTCVGSAPIDMPLFLKPEHYIPVPLESTYMRSWAGVPRRWQRELPS